MSIYLDNAATTFPKPESVYQMQDRVFREKCANPGRGGHSMAIEAARVVLEAREVLADFFQISDPAQLVFTSGATEAINLGLFGLLEPGDRVVTTSMEHNAVTRPLRALADRGLRVEKVQGDALGFVHPDHIRQACLKEKTRLLLMSHCSNVTGTLQAIEEIGPWCRKHGILFMVDAAQSAGVFPIHVETLGIDLLAVPGHKGLMGPQGTGMLYVHPGLRLKPLIFGGTGANSHSDLAPEDMPERLESGTLNTPGIAGLMAGASFIRDLGLDTLRHHEENLMEVALQGLKGIPEVEIHGMKDHCFHGGVLSFNIKEKDPSEVGFLLDHDHGICARTGLHCAPDAHRTIGTFPRGTVRISPGYFNTTRDMEHLVEAVSAIAARTGRKGG